MKTAALVLALAVLATPVFSQNRGFAVSFDVGNDEELSRNVMNRVMKQIDQVLADQMAKRYAQGLCDTGGLYIAPSPKDRQERQDITITITCTHGFCFSNLEYWPIREIGLHTTLGNCIAEGSEAELAQKIIDHYAQNTSVEQLAFASRRFKTLLNRAIIMFPKGVK
jgi:hypothetical protein